MSASRREFLFGTAAMAVAPVVPGASERVAPSVIADPASLPSSVGTSGVDMSLDVIGFALQSGGLGGDMVLHTIQMVDLIDDLRREAGHTERIPDALAALFALDLRAGDGMTYRGEILGVRLWTYDGVPLCNGGADRCGWYVGSRETVAVISDSEAPPKTPYEWVASKVPMQDVTIRWATDDEIEAWRREQAGTIATVTVDGMRAALDAMPREVVYLPSFRILGGP